MREDMKWRNNKEGKVGIDIDDDDDGLMCIGADGILVVVQLCR